MIAVPDLDTIDFDALFEEARGLIPRFAPDWTDHNLHDPGMTILDLLAWIVDQQVYRLGFVGDSHLRAFAALMGVRGAGATPARGLIWPGGPLASDADLVRGTVIVPPAQPDLRFRLDDDLHLSDAQAMRIAVRRAGGVESAAGFAERIALAPGDRLDLVFDRPLAAAAASAPVALGIAIENSAPDAKHRWGPLVFDYAVGDDPPQRLAVIRDDTAALARTGIVLLAIPPAASGIATIGIRTDAGYFPLPPVITAIALNVLPISQIDSGTEAVLGEGTGLPDQTLPFDSASIVEGAVIVVATGEGGDPVPWNETSDLTLSGPDDRHFIIDRRRATIRFGNGVNGRVPPAGVQITAGAMERTLGGAGNIGGGRHWHVTGLDGVFGINQAAITGGGDATTIDDLVDALQVRAGRREAMLTNDEMRVAAAGLPGFGIGRADVLPGFFPALSAHPVCGARTLVVRPDSAVPATAGYIAAVAEALTPRRVLGERLSIIAPTLVTIDIAATIIVTAAEAAVCTRVDARVRDRLSDLTRGSDIAPWPIGRPVTPGEIESLIAATDGVRAVTALSLARRGGGSLTLAPTEVAIAGDVALATTIAGTDA